MKKVFWILVLAFFSISCASAGRKIDQSAVAKIEKGKSTREEVIRLLGSPDNITVTGGGNTIFSYSYTRVSAKPATFIPIVGAFAGGANIQHQMYMVTIGPDGVVKDFMGSFGATESDTGVATGTKTPLPEVEADKRPK